MDNKHECGEAAEGNIMEQMVPMEQASTPRDRPSTQHINSEGLTTTFKGSSNSDISAAREALSKEAQQLIEDINAKRRQDTQLLTDFKAALDRHVQKACAQVEHTMFEIYERESKIVQEKLQHLFSILDRISRNEDELTQFKMALGALYQDMAQDR